VSLRKKILSGYFIMIVFMAIISFQSFDIGRRTLEQFSGINKNLVPMLGLIDEINSNIAGQSSDERGFLLTGEENYVKSFIAKAEATDEIIKDEIETAPDENEKAKWLKIKGIYDQYNDIQQQVVAAYKSGNVAEAKRLSFEVGRDKRKELDPIFAEFKTEIDTDIKNANAEVQRIISIGKLINIIVSMAAVIFGLILGLFTAGKIVIPIKEIVEHSKRVAGGDLSVNEIEVKTRDEVKELADAFNTMIINVRNAMKKILDSAQTVAATSGQLSNNAEQAEQATQQVARAIQEVARGSTDQADYISKSMDTINQVGTAIQQIATGAQEQASNIQLTAEMVGQVASSIQDVALSAQSVSESAERTTKAADQGEKAVNLTIKGMDGIKNKVFESANKIKELGEHSQHIGDIIQVIDDIAEQTNLLALNAAIEAARAGEHGKGFAVVADEVRKLAERSSKATKEIADLINNIQKLTLDAVTAMEQGTGEVEQGAKLALDAGNALKEILSTVEDTYRQVQNISAAAEEISAGSQEVVTAIDNTSAITQENTAATQELTAASEQVTSAMEGIAVITEETSASAEEVSASTEEVLISISEIANSSKEVADLADSLNAVVGKFKLREITERCWDIRNCGMEYRTKCPAYNAAEVRCWLIPGTWCGGIKQGDERAKRHTCMNCTAFKQMN